MLTIKVTGWKKDGFPTKKTKCPLFEIIPIFELPNNFSMQFKNTIINQPPAPATVVNPLTFSMHIVNCLAPGRLALFFYYAKQFTTNPHHKKGR